MKQYVKPMIITEEEIQFETLVSCPLYKHEGTVGGTGGFSGGD
ncbi:hypothetical protein [Phosphitispora fastidiosa]|nr:hypothetical protein [Phosphitispora fastidiosa]MBU7007244.1 hypothetical protein [Phosphitispora fastidiosa]